MSKIPTIMLASLILLLSLVSCSKKNPPPKPQRPIAIKFEEAKLQDLAQYFETVAELKAHREIAVSAEKAGQIENIFVEEGHWVKKGSVLLNIKAQDIIAEIAKAKADYESYKQLYDEGAVSKLEYLSFKTNLDRLQADYDRLRLKAISSGIVGKINVDPGDFVRVGDQIMDLVHINPMRVSYNVPEKLIPYIKLGQSVELRSSVYPKEVFKAKVDFVSPLVDKDTRAILVRASLTSNPKDLKPNQFMKVKQKVLDKRNSVVVREEALFLEQGEEFIYLAAPAEEEGFYVADRRVVKTGIRKPGIVEITEGIEAGDSIVYAGLFSIYPGAKLIPSELAAQQGP
ncbi:MAG: efflux RND transporter periplasmic adaptor subunit [Candidatus Caenarcaniphilales bacterium]|nr:efflux RND transporter periplasmic adaptor subunit [Candidatus Caenarcaniphilales bacterium]